MEALSRLLMLSDEHFIAACTVKISDIQEFTCLYGLAIWR